jgi:hypothetical protein
MEVVNRYIEKKFVIFPVNEQKAPDLKGYPTWKIEDSSEILDAFKNENIAIRTGEINKIVVLDIDIEIPEIKAEIENVLKDYPTPVLRQGKKTRLASRFYSYNGEPSSAIMFTPSSGIPERAIEIISDNRYCVIPPTKRADGYRFEWVGSGLLDIPSVDYLPPLKQELIEKLKSVINKYSSSKMVTTVTPSDGTRCNHGSHDILSRMLSAAIHAGDPPSVIVKNLLEYDSKINPDISYFVCPGRSEWKVKNREANALKFVTQGFESHIKRGEIKEVPLEETVINLSIDKYKEMPKLEKMKLPKLSGMAQEMFEYIMENSTQERTHLIYPTVMSVISTIIGNKVQFKGVFPNLYTLVVGESGTGKSSSQDFAADLFSQSPYSLNLLSDTSISSVNGITQNLKTDRVQLKIIDEAAALFKRINDEKSLGEDIGSVLAELYTKTGKRFGGKSTSNAKTDRNKKGNIGGCFSPYVNLLMATTFEAFESSFTKNILNHGFFARADFYFDKKTLKDKDRKNTPIPKHFIEFVEMWRTLPNEPLFEAKPDKKTINLVEADPAFIPFKIAEAQLDKTAESTFDKIKEEIRNRKYEIMSSKDTGELLTRVMINRQEVLWMKYALISAVSNNPKTTDVVIKEKDLVFAMKLVQVNCNNAEILLSEHMYEGRRKVVASKILAIIKKMGGATTTDITRALYKITSTKEREEVIKDLVQASMISPENTQKGGKIFRIL